MAKTKKPEQAIFYQNFKGAIYGGTPEQVKNLMTAFCQYAFDGIEQPSIAPDIAMTFGMMKASVDADRKHYQEVCEQNRINALKKCFGCMGTIKKTVARNIALEIDTSLILPPKLLQLLVGVLGIVHTHNDRHSRVTAVQGTDATLQGVVQPGKGLVIVLPALYRFMIGRCTAVGRYLPAVTAKVVMVLLRDLLLHQSQAAHDVPPDSCFQ